jgi:hypothetical protein
MFYAIMNMTGYSIIIKKKIVYLNPSKFFTIWDMIEFFTNNEEFKQYKFHYSISQIGNLRCLKISYKEQTMFNQKKYEEIYNETYLHKGFLSIQRYKEFQDLLKGKSDFLDSDKSTSDKLFNSVKRLLQNSLYGKVL